MFDDESASSAPGRIDEWERSMARRAEQARTQAQRAAGNSAAARSQDGLVEITIGAEGRIEHLHLDERSRHQSAEQAGC